MRQSIEDGVTLEIVYEGRTHNAEVSSTKQAWMQLRRMFSATTTFRKGFRFWGYGSRDAYLEPDRNHRGQSATIWFAHYLTHVFPNGYKAQIVATSREAAVRYKKHLDDALSEAIAKPDKWNPGNVDMVLLKRVQTDVIISGRHNDELHLKPYTDASKHKTTIKSFKLPFGSEDEGVKGDIGIVIVPICSSPALMRPWSR